MPSGFENLGILILLLLWTLPWKGVALWRASHRKEKKWFTALLVLNTLAVLEILYIFVFSKRAGDKKGPRSDAFSAARKAVKSRKAKNKEKILESLSQRGQISNADVELLLNVSDATATRYLDELEKEKKIRQKGKTGRGVFYVPR